MQQKRAIQETHLYREIHEQPSTLARLLEAEQGNIAALAHEIHTRRITHIIVAARGTSDNAGRYAQYVLGAYNNIYVGLATPSLFSVYHSAPRFHNALVLGISQSGKSPDIVGVLAEARRQGALTAAITNDTGSDLAAEGDIVIGLHAGRELAVAATKTYTSQLATIAMLSAALSENPDQRADLAGVPEAVAKILGMNDLIAATAPRYRYMERSVIIGRGYNYATAFELALKLKELTYTLIEPYSSADFQHGPMALVENGFPLLIIAPHGAMQPELAEFIGKMQAREAEIVAFSDEAEILRLARTPLPLTASVPEWLSPITTIVAGQLFAMHLADTRDYDIDAPRGLSKVTETL